MSMKGPNDELLHNVINLALFLDNCRKAPSHWLDYSIRKKNTDKRANERRTDETTQNNRRLIDSAHGFHNAKNARNDAQRR